MDRMHVNTGIRLTVPQMEKLDRIAKSIGASRNRTFGLLIDAAEVQTVPSVSVGLPKNNRHDAQNLHGSSITAVSA